MVRIKKESLSKKVVEKVEDKEDEKFLESVIVDKSTTKDYEYSKNVK